MHLTSLLTAASLARYTLALPSYGEDQDVGKHQVDHRWIPGTTIPGAARAACPGLSTLANHNYIPRNGRGISVAQMQQGFLDAFGMGKDATAAGGQNALNLCGTITGKKCTTFDLDMVNRPHSIEHDASLTCLDRNMSYSLHADNFHFNASVWGMTRAWFGNAPRVGVELANTARLGRIQQAKSQDAPGWFVENVGGSLTEHGFYLTTMRDPESDPNDPKARLDWMDYWFCNRRLPTAIGWKKPTQTISNTYLQRVVSSVKNAPTIPPKPKNKRDLSVAGKLLDVEGERRPKMQAAYSSATEKAGPAPTMVNAYEQVLSSEEWAEHGRKVKGYVDKVVDMIGDGIL